VISRTRAAGYAGPLEVGQDLTLFEIGETISTLRCPSVSSPAVAAATNAAYQTKITTGDTLVLWGSDFSVGGNTVFLTPASGSGSSVILNESDGLYFWDRSSGQINAALPATVTKGACFAQVQTSCIVNSPASLVTIN
jgi:uncharacterized protein (TIGR03437 family)